MLSVLAAEAPQLTLARLRETEFQYLDEQGLCYLDYTGSALPARSQLEAQQEIMRASVFGNPHSLHGPSRRSTGAIEQARDEVLRFLDADPAEYAVCFTANSSAAIKLVAEAFPFGPRSTLLLSQDNHNSVNGIREFAVRRRARVRTIPLDDELRLAAPRQHIAAGRPHGPSLFAFPAQSNFSGVKHPLSLVSLAQRCGFRVLLDAAALAPSTPLSLRLVRPDFVALSMYKLFGFPSGVGALVARRDALEELDRPWFAGGTVDWVSTLHPSHRLRSGVEGFEDGTINFHGIAALTPGFAFLEGLGMTSVSAHVRELTSTALRLLRAERHANRRPVVQVYGPLTTTDRGGTVAFNVLNASGGVVHYEQIERHAAAQGVAVRGGCFCNPGASEAAFGFQRQRLRQCLDTVRTGAFSPRRLGDCLGPGVAIGAVRLSVGVANTVADIERAVEAIVSPLLP